MTVKIINPDEVKDLFKHWGEFSKVCYNTQNVAPEKIGKHCLNSGHFSGSRTRYIELEISGVPRSCYDEKTEILTKDGWKFFKDIANDEIVATLNKDTHKVEFHKINEKIEYNYKGKMSKIKTQSVDLCITNNHNLFLQTDGRNDRPNKKFEWELRKVEDVPYAFHMTKDFNYYNEVPQNIIIQGYEYPRKESNGVYSTRRTSDLDLCRENFYKFLAWYISEGSIWYCDKEKKYKITITQNDNENNIKNRERICEIVKNMGLTPVKTKQGIAITNRTLGRYLKKLGTAGQKYIPLDIFKDFNRDYAKIFIEEYLKGDGHVDKNGVGFLYTGSNKLADQLNILCFMAGWTSHKRERNADLVGKKSVICGRVVNINLHSYVINISFHQRNRFPHIFSRKHITSYEANEKVYCVNVKNNVIFVRRNGKSIWCGNCIDQLCRHEQGVVKNVQSTRYVDKNGFTYDIPIEIQDNDNLVYDFVEHMETTKQLYSLIQQYIISKGKSKERANEQARNVLPLGVHTNCTIGFTLEALIHYMNVRLCTRAEKEHRDLAKAIRKAVLEVLPYIEEWLVPQCQALLYCPEAHGCGLYPNRKETIARLKAVNEEYNAQSNKNICKNTKNVK